MKVFHEMGAINVFVNSMFTQPANEIKKKNKKERKTSALVSRIPFNIS